MAITVGLDFGTHQTKLCIEDSSDPLLKRYTFFGFTNLEGKESMVLPSIVQINQDGSLSYGNVNFDEARKLVQEVEDLPEFSFSEYQPKPSPTSPQLKKYPTPPSRATSSKDLRDLAGLLGSDRKEVEYRLLCKQIDEANNLLKTAHEVQLSQYRKAESERENEWQIQKNAAVQEYNRKRLELERSRKKILQFRYFKTAALGDSRHWDFEITQFNPQLISVLYLAYVLYQIEAKYGVDVYVQMGVPQSLGTREGVVISEIGYQLLLLARKITTDWSYEDFLALKFDELKELVDLKQAVNDQLKLEYGINILPEAYAGLVALTAQRRIPRGFSLLVDIGGGTTDLALFTLEDNGRAPDIAKVESVQGGLNSILRALSEELGCSLPDIQLNFKQHIDSPAGIRAREVLNGSIRKKVTDIIQELVQRFGDDRPRHGLANEALTRVLRDRPIYYCGGGGVYRALQIPNNHFSDVKQVSLNEMGIQNLTNTIHPPFDTILAVSYGLSILSDAELVVTPLDELFKHLDGGEGFRRNVREYLE